MTGVEGGFILEGVWLELGYFGALGAGMISSTIWFVADVLKLTIGAAASTTVEVVTDAFLTGVLRSWWWGGSCRGGARSAGRGGGRGGCEGTKRLVRLGSGGTTQSTVTIGVAMNAEGEGLLLQNIVVQLFVHCTPGHGEIGGSHIAKGRVIHKPS